MRDFPRQGLEQIVLVKVAVYPALLGLLQHFAGEIEGAQVVLTVLVQKLTHEAGAGGHVQDAGLLRQVGQQGLADFARLVPTHPVHQIALVAGRPLRINLAQLFRRARAA